MYCSCVYISVRIQWTQCRFVTHVLFCCLPLSTHTVDPVQICYTCIVLLFTPQYTYSGPSSDLLHMYCSAVYTSVHIQWTQFRFVTHVLFCCLPLSTHTVDPVQICYTCIVLLFTSQYTCSQFRFVTHVLFCCLPLSTHTVDPVQICYTCIVLLFTSQYTYSGPSSDLLHMYCSAVYTLSTHTVDPVQICYTCIVLLFTPQYTYSGPSSDLLHMYCSAVYPSVHIQWTQFRFVTHVLFCCLHLSTHTVDPVQICYTCIVLLFTPQYTYSGPSSDLLHMYCSAVYTSVHIQWDPVQICYTCIVLLFTSQYTYSGPSSDLLHMYCSVCLPLSTHTVDPVQICYTCIVLLFTPQYTYSGPSSDLLHMYCSAVYISVHIQWTQFRFVTHVLFCCLPLSTHTVDSSVHMYLFTSQYTWTQYCYCSAVYPSVHIQWTQFRFVTHVLFYCLHLSTHTVDPVQICYTCIVLLFTPQYTYSGPSSDLLPMYCSAVYPSVHIQWTQFRFVTHGIVLLFTPQYTYRGPSSDLLPMYCSAVYPSVHIQWTQFRFVNHVLFCCLHLSTHTVDPVQICYPCIVLLFTPQYTYSGPSSDLLHMYCSAVYPSVHIQWYPVQICYTCIVLLFTSQCTYSGPSSDLLHMYCSAVYTISTHTVDPVQICYPCIVLLFTPQCTYSGPSSDLLHMYCSAVYTSVHIQWDPVQICYPCIVLLFTPQYTYSGPSSDLLTMYCSAVYISVHIQWTQFRFVTHVLFCCLPLSTHTVDPVQICYTCMCSAVYPSVHIQWTQFRFVTHVLFCCLHLSAHTVDPVQICYTCIVLLFTPQYTYSGPSSDLLHMYCSAVYTSVHIQWTQFRFVTHVLFCCLPLSKHTVDPVQICYPCIVLLFTPQYTYSGHSSDLLHMYCSAVYTSVHIEWTQFRFVTHVLFCCLPLSTHTVDPVQICYTWYCSAVYPSVHIQWTQFRFVNTCIVLLFTPQYTYSGLSSNLIHMVLLCC